MPKEQKTWNLGEFVLDAIANIRRFEEHYTAQMNNPTNYTEEEGEFGTTKIVAMYPDRMPPGEWDEQLRAFEEG